METETNNKKRYVDAWNLHIEQLNLLAFTPSRELEIEVEETLRKLKGLVVKVAEDKGLN